MQKFKVGDKVRLTGELWQAPQYPERGSIVTIAKVDFDGLGRINTPNGWAVVPTDGRHYMLTAEHFGGEVVQPVVDSTGYPVGTPRAEKNIPETEQVKGTYQETGETDADKAALLAEFNRWYERELEEARAEGYTQGAADVYTQLNAKTAIIVFSGPFERYTGPERAEQRLSDLADEGTYGTYVRVTTTGGSVDGASVRPPALVTPEAVN